MSVLFMYNNLVDVSTAVTSTSTGRAAFPTSNLQHPFRTKVWKTDTGAVNVTFNLSTAPGKITACALVNYDWTGTTGPKTLNLELSASSAFSTGAAVTEALAWKANPTTNSNPGCVVKTFTSVAYPWARLSVDSTQDTTGWSLGRIFLGNYLQPTDDYRYAGYSLGFTDPSIASQTVGGQEHTDEITDYRTVSMDFVVASQAQLEKFQKMWATVGRSKHLFCAFDYDNEPDEMTMYGKFTGSLQTNRVANSVFGLKLGFKEAR